MSQIKSIRRQLWWHLSGGLAILWLVAMLVGAWLVWEELDEGQDSHMAQLANALIWTTQKNHTQQEIVQLEQSLGEQHGDIDDEDYGFAIWDNNKQLLLADEYGKHIPFQQQSGFSTQGDWWVVYLQDPNTGHTVAVSQRVSERREMLLHALNGQLILTLLVFPLLFVLLFVVIKRGLLPLNRLSDELCQRDADSLQAVSEDVPVEISPVVKSLNQLFERVSAAMLRERRFTSDASHELRSPLAALKIHADVLAMTDDEQERQHHIHQIKQGIIRAERLTEQLLVLSRIDPLQTVPNAAPIDWQSVCEQALQSVNLQAREKRVKLRLQNDSDWAQILPIQGDKVLLELMLRNVLDNAVRYSPEQTQVTLQLSPHAIEVCDEGAGIAAEHLPRIRERFYRPAGQAQQGSGLGLSIVERIGQLHGLRLSVENRAEGGLCVRLRPAGLRVQRKKLIQAA